MKFSSAKEGERAKGLECAAPQSEASCQLLLAGMSMPEVLKCKWHVNQKHLSLLCWGCMWIIM